MHHVDGKTAAGFKAFAEVLRTLRKWTRSFTARCACAARLSGCNCRRSGRMSLESARKITLMFGKENAAPFMDLVPFVMPVLYFRSLFCRYSSYSFFSTGSDGVG